jgi:hypothetical protein
VDFCESEGGKAAQPDMKNPIARMRSRGFMFVRLVGQEASLLPQVIMISPNQNHLFLTRRNDRAKALINPTHPWTK